MARYDAGKETFEEITVLGKPALFTGIRIDRSTVPEGLFLYEVRHDDEGLGDPVQIARGILVNHLGSIITCEPVLLPPDGYLELDGEQDWIFSGGDCRTVAEFQKKYLENGSTKGEGYKGMQIQKYKDIGIRKEAEQ